MADQKPDVKRSRIARVKGNVEKLLKADVDDAVLAQYLQQEGYDIDSFSRAVAEANAAGGRVKTYGAKDAAVAGATFGFSDEVMSALTAMGETMRPSTMAPPGMQGKPPKQVFDEEMAAHENARSDYASQSPVTNFAAELGGSAVPAALTMGGSAEAQAARTAARSLPKQMARGAAGGAAFGSVAGAGHSQGGIKERLKGMLWGATGGALVGGAVPPVAAGARMAMGALADVTGARSARGAEVAAREKVGQALAADQMTPQDLAARAAAAAEAGVKPEVVADFGGENTRMLLRSAAGREGATAERARTLMDERQGEQGTRVLADLEAGMGTPQRSVRGMADELREKTKAAAGPAYKAAYEAGQAVPVTPEMAQFLTLPHIGKAWREAQRLAEFEGVPMGNLYEEVVDAAGKKSMQMRKEVPLQWLDYLKRSTGDLISNTYRAPGERGGLGGAQTARALSQRQEGFLGELDKAVPEYGAARQQFKGDLEMEKALDIGRTLLNEPTEEVVAAMASATPAEQTMLRFGVTAAVRELIGNTRSSANAVQRIFGSKNWRTKLQAVFPDQRAYQMFEQQMMREAAMSRTNNAALGGSITSRGMGFAADAEALPSSVGMSLLTGDLGGAAAGAGRAALAGRADAGRGRTADYIGELLLSQNAKGAARKVTAVERLLEQQARKRAENRALIARLLGEQAGLAQDE